MTDDLQVEREVVLELSADDLWELVGSADGWQQWLVDSAALEVTNGGEGEVVDDGVRRQVRVTEVVTDQRVAFDWWEDGDPSSMSHVVIDITPHRDGGSVVRVVERPLTVAASAATGAVWDRRLLLLALSFIALARV